MGGVISLKFPPVLRELAAIPELAVAAGVTDYQPEMGWSVGALPGIGQQAQYLLLEALRTVRQPTLWKLLASLLKLGPPYSTITRVNLYAIHELYANEEAARAIQAVGTLTPGMTASALTAWLDRFGLHAWASQPVQALMVPWERAESVSAVFTANKSVAHRPIVELARRRLMALAVGALREAAPTTLPIEGGPGIHA